MDKFNFLTTCGSKTTFLQADGSVRCDHCGFYISAEHFKGFKEWMSAKEIQDLEARSKARAEKLQMPVREVLGSDHASKAAH